MPSTFDMGEERIVCKHCKHVVVKQLLREHNKQHFMPRGKPKHNIKGHKHRLSAFHRKICRAQNYRRRSPQNFRRRKPRSPSPSAAYECQDDDQESEPSVDSNELVNAVTFVRYTLNRLGYKKRGSWEQISPNRLHFAPYSGATVEEQCNRIIMELKKASTVKTIDTKFSPEYNSEYIQVYLMNCMVEVWPSTPETRPVSPMKLDGYTTSPRLSPVMGVDGETSADSAEGHEEGLRRKRQAVRHGHATEELQDECTSRNTVVTAVTLVASTPTPVMVHTATAFVPFDLSCTNTGISTRVLDPPPHSSSDDIVDFLGLSMEALDPPVVSTGSEGTSSVVSGAISPSTPPATVPWSDFFSRLNKAPQAADSSQDIPTQESTQQYRTQAATPLPQQTPAALQQQPPTMPPQSHAIPEIPVVLLTPHISLPQTTTVQQDTISQTTASHLTPTHSVNQPQGTSQHKAATQAQLGAQLTQFGSQLAQLGDVQQPSLQPESKRVQPSRKAKTTTGQSTTSLTLVQPSQESRQQIDRQSVLLPPPQPLPTYTATQLGHGIVIVTEAQPPAIVNHKHKLLNSNKAPNNQFKTLGVSPNLPEEYADCPRLTRQSANKPAHPPATQQPANKRQMIQLGQTNNKRSKVDTSATLSQNVKTATQLTNTKQQPPKILKLKSTTTSKQTVNKQPTPTSKSTTTQQPLKRPVPKPTTTTQSKTQKLSKTPSYTTSTPPSRNAPPTTLLIASAAATTAIVPTTAPAKLSLKRLLQGLQDAGREFEKKRRR